MQCEEELSRSPQERALNEDSFEWALRTADGKAIRNKCATILGCFLSYVLCPFEVHAWGLALENGTKYIDTVEKYRMVSTCRYGGLVYE